MSVIRCALAEEPPRLSEDKRFRSTIPVMWNVETDDPTDGPIAVKAGAEVTSPDPLPPLWTTYSYHGESDTSIFLKRREVQPRHGAQGRTMWRVIGHYEPLEPQEQPDDSNPDPFLRPVKYRLEHVTYTEVVDVDKDDKPIVNSAGQEFDEPLEQEKSRMVLVADQIVPDLQTIINHNLTWAGKVNSTPYRGGGPRMWFVHTIGSSDLLSESGVDYYVATWRLELNFDTWDRKVLNRGFKHYDNAADKKLVIAKDKDGLPVNEPILLATDGTRLGDGIDGNFLSFRVKDEVSFAGFPV